MLVSSYCVVFVLLLLLLGCGLAGIVMNSLYGTSGPTLAFKVPLCYNNETNAYYLHNAPCNETATIPQPLYNVSYGKSNTHYMLPGQTYVFKILRIQASGPLDISFTFANKNYSFDNIGDGENIYPINYYLLAYDGVNGTSGCNDPVTGCYRRSIHSMNYNVLPDTSFVTDGEEFSFTVNNASLTQKLNEYTSIYIRIDPQGTHPTQDTATILMSIACFVGIIAPFFEGLVHYIIKKARK